MNDRRDLRTLAASDRTLQDCARTLPLGSDIAILNCPQMGFCVEGNTFNKTRPDMFKGNEYWFWLGTEVETSKVSVHIYDSEGKLVEMPDSWQKGHFAAAHITPKNTGSYFIIVEIEQSPEERTHWALVYGFR